MGSRREFLKGAVAGGLGATTALVAGQVVSNVIEGGASERPTGAKSTSSEPVRLSALGAHQPGIDAEPLASTTLLSLDIRPDVTIDQMRSWMTILADDIDRLMEHREMLADPQPELTELKGRLAIVVGFGPSLFKKLDLEHMQPEGFAELPKFKIDKLVDSNCNGDILLMVSSDSPLQEAHAERSLLRDSSYFANLRWRQRGFSAIDPSSPLRSQRNLMGQLDGTGSPQPGSESFNRSVWGQTDHDAQTNPSWYAGGTTLVYRKIEMNLDTWDVLDRKDKEKVIGRSLSNGAPLGGTRETDFLDLNSRDDRGFLVIPGFAHVRQAQAAEGSLPLFRKPFNYVEHDSDGRTKAGLAWLAYAHNANEQYLPIQKRLADFDLLNKWTTPVASAVFAIPRGRKKVSDPICGGLFA
ncbi:MAG: Dyp-type peroxidase [Actinomycetales bacterium]|nr:Dyp-type peroxidase [Actinomycetales bacterium]